MSPALASARSASAIWMPAASGPNWKSWVPTNGGSGSKSSISSSDGSASPGSAPGRSSSGASVRSVKATLASASSPPGMVSPSSNRRRMASTVFSSAPSPISTLSSRVSPTSSTRAARPSGASLIYSSSWNGLCRDYVERLQPRTRSKFVGTQALYLKLGEADAWIGDDDQAVLGRFGFVVNPGPGSAGGVPDDRRQLRALVGEVGPVRTDPQLLPPNQRRPRSPLRGPHDFVDLRQALDLAPRILYRPKHRASSARKRARADESVEHTVNVEKAQRLHRSPLFKFSPDSLTTGDSGQVLLTALRYPLLPERPGA